VVRGDKFGVYFCLAAGLLWAEDGEHQGRQGQGPGFRTTESGICPITAPVLCQFLDAEWSNCDVQVPSP
jgi:hypothetical protein